MKRSAILCLVGLFWAAGSALAAEDGIDQLRANAEKGDAQAQTLLCLRYLNGNGVAKDPVEAVKWARKAAEQGFAKAQLIVATMYSEGAGVPRDLAEAAKWYRKAAEQGEPKAQLNLGIMYAIGQGAPKDFVQAHAWINVAGAQGDEEAKSFLPKIEKSMTDGQRVAAMKLAKKMWDQLPKKVTDPQR